MPEKEAFSGLQPYIEQGHAFFRGLHIPCSFANKVTALYMKEELKECFQIKPQWLDFDKCFEDGKDFAITDISGEIRQFPNLRPMIFHMYHKPLEGLVKKLRRLGLRRMCRIKKAERFVSFRM